MDSLPEWVVSVIAIGIGLSPGLAILSARSIARLLYRVLAPRPEGEGRSGVEPAHGEPAGFPAPRVTGAQVARQ
jgi:hypothetical protein